MANSTTVRLTSAVEVQSSFIADYVDIYKHLHANPELSAQESKTALYIEGVLANLGIENFRCGGTGVVAILRNGAGPVIAFRADTDGLPILEQTGLDASQANGILTDGTVVPVMHGCGHDTPYNCRFSIGWALG